MDYTALIKKSFSYVWHNRVLWVFGFLSAGAGGSGFVNPSGINLGGLPTSFEDSGEKVQGVSKVLGASTSYPIQLPPDTIILLVVIIAIVVLLVVIISAFITNWAASSLVFSILNRNKERTTFKIGAKGGLKYWWVFLKINLTFVLIFMGVLAMLAVPVILLFLSQMQIFAIFSLIIAAIIFFVFIFAFSLLGSLVITISQRISIHRDKGALESIRLSGGLIKKNIGESALTWLVAAGLSFGAGFVVIIAMLPIIAVIAVMFFLNIWLGLVAIIPALLLFFAASGLWQSFLATYWTLFYEHLAAREGW